MAYLQARSGIARSGVTYCGWTPPNIVAYIGGVDRTASILRDGNWRLQTRADGTPPIFQFTTKTITPVVGQDVKVTYTTPDEYLFAGTLLQRNTEPVSPSSSVLQWVCTAVGYQWLLDRYALVLAQYDSVGVGTMVADLLYRFTNGGFRVGYIPSSLGNLTMTFTFETVYDALQRIAVACGAVLDLGPDKIVSIYPAGTYPEVALSTLTEAGILTKSLAFREDLTQVRTREIFRGQGSSASAVVSPGATLVPVEDASVFSPSGGTAVSGVNMFTYTGLTASSGPGSLSGCSGILRDIKQGDAVDIIVDANDASKIAALATILGGGLSGQATNYVEDNRISISEGTARTTADLAAIGGALEEPSFTMKTPQRYIRAGRSFTLNVANPLSISGTFTIQSVELVPYGVIGGTKFEVRQKLQLGSFTRSLNDLLQQLRG
jgi:hypothetical protein